MGRGGPLLLPQDLFPDTIVHNLAAITFGAEYTIPKQPSLAQLKPSDYQSLKGKYRVSSQMNFTINPDMHSLLVEVTGGTQARFFPESETLFYQQFGNRQIEFVRNDRGNIYKLILKQDGIDIKAYKL